MKIGIVTFYNTQDNYGEVLQHYALKTFLNKLGHEVFLLQCNKSHKCNMVRLICNIVASPMKYLVEIKRRYKYKSYLSEIRSHPRNFDEFRNKYFCLTEEVYEQDKLSENLPFADAYICGSDQIWANVNWVNYLGFVPNGIKKIAYAPSFGGLNFSKNEKKILADYIKDFDIITLREHSGVDLCRQLGRMDATLVPDPTFLLSDIDYEVIMDNDLEEGKYLFLYLLGNETEIDMDSIYSFAEEKGVKVKYVASQGLIDKCEKEYPTIERWIGLIKQAEYVLTNSFHGMAFSIIFNKNFMIIPLSGVHKRMNDRIDTALLNYGLQDRIFQGNYMPFDNVIDYNLINDIIKAERVNIGNKFNYWLK